jgi:serine/threonine protein phosphatase 1
MERAPGESTGVRGAGLSAKPRMRGLMMFFARPKAQPRAPTGAAASLPNGLRVYAIGDIHGRLDLLQVLSNKLRNDLRDHPSENAIVVLLGDYIDRGPDSAGVIDWFLAAGLPAPAIALRGNHEATLLNFLVDETVLDNWRHFGGLETLSCYGVDVRDAMRGRNYAAAQAKLREVLPPTHQGFFDRTKLSWSSGDYFFCHAGVKPNVPLQRQEEQDLLWIRDEFNDFRGAFDKMIVHGHTPVAAPEILPNRINIDTGAYATDVLTCLVLEGRERRFIST